MQFKNTTREATLYSLVNIFKNAILGQHKGSNSLFLSIYTNAILGHKIREATL